MRTIAVFIGFLVLSSSAHAAGTDKDFDLACAISGAAIAGVNPPESVETRTAMMVNFYFLGRLSGRDSNTLWSAIVTGRLAEMKGKALSPEYFGKCVEFLTKQM